MSTKAKSESIADSEDEVFGDLHDEDIPIISSSESWHDSDASASSEDSEEGDDARIRTANKDHTLNNGAAQSSSHVYNKLPISPRTLLRTNRKSYLNNKTSRRAYRGLLREMRQPYPDLELEVNEETDSGESLDDEIGSSNYTTSEHVVNEPVRREIDRIESDHNDPGPDDSDQDESTSNGIDSESLQIGAVKWTHSEQDRFFVALSRKGRFCVHKIAQEIKTKSQLEVSEYIKYMDAAQSEQTSEGPIGTVEIPAAVEINKGLETALERFAEHVSVREQTRESRIKGKEYGHEYWNIDSDTAEKIEATLAHNDAAFQPSNTTPVFQYAKYLKFGKWIKLSRRLFMNSGKSRYDNNWRKYAYRGETPSLTAEAFGQFYSLLLDTTKRVTHAAMSIAQDRLVKSKHRQAPVRHVRKSDVRKALTIMGMRHDSFHYYMHLARRLHLDVAQISHRKGVQGEYLSYDRVEEILSKRRRCKSTTKSSRTSPSGLTSADDDRSDNNEIDRDAYETSTSWDYGSDLNSNDEQDDEVMKEELIDDLSDGDAMSPPPAAENLPNYQEIGDFGAEEQAEDEIERQQDEYNAYVDRQASEREDALLRNLLRCRMIRSLDPFTKPEQDEQEPPKPPSTGMVQKKLVDDWSARLTYQAEWETYGKGTPEVEGDIASNHKKRRIE